MIELFPRLGERIDLPVDGLSGGSSKCVPWGWAHSLAPPVHGGRVIPWLGSHRGRSHLQGRQLSGKVQVFDAQAHTFHQMEIKNEENLCILCFKYKN